LDALAFDLHDSLVMKVDTGLSNVNQELYHRGERYVCNP
jgi:hypothetical protein